MLLQGHPTLGSANIAAWMNTQVHFLPLKPKCKQESMELKREVSLAKKKREKKNKPLLVEVRWLQAILFCS